jgi:hypothetical protein
MSQDKPVAQTPITQGFQSKEILKPLQENQCCNHHSALHSTAGCIHQVVVQNYQLLNIIPSSVLLHSFTSLPLALSLSSLPSSPNLHHLFVDLAAALTMACIKMSILQK